MRALPSGQFKRERKVDSPPDSGAESAEDRRINPNRADAFKRLLVPILAEVQADDRGLVAGTQVPVAAVPLIARRMRDLSASGQRRGRWLNRFLTERAESDEDMVDGINLGQLRKLVQAPESPAEDFNFEAAVVRRNIQSMKEARAEGGDVVETKLMSGTQFDRLAGLEALSEICPGRSVLDIGCHRGLISYEAAKSGATLVHGIDLYPQGIAAAREIFKDAGIPNQFIEFDLSLGRDAVVEALGDVLLPRYDIVLMLAVLQHLRRQMDSGELDDLFDFFVDRAGTYLVLRMPNIEAVHPRLAKSGFRRTYFNEIDKKLAPVAIYQR
jgi:hypothetical protein